jgi:hypothetical protein
MVFPEQLASVPARRLSSGFLYDLQETHLGARGSGVAGLACWEKTEEVFRARY